MQAKVKILEDRSDTRTKTDSSVIDALLWAARLSSFERTGSVEELFFESSGGAFSK